MIDKMKIHDLVEHEFLRDEVCVITIKEHGPTRNQKGLIEAFCGLLNALYKGPVKLVIFQGYLKQIHITSNSGEVSVDESCVIEQTKAGMLQDIISRAPFFTLSRMAGQIDDLYADIAISCDWRLVSEVSQLCFAARRNLNEVRTSTRLAELIGSFRAFDNILRRRAISAKEAVEIGLSLSVAQEENIVAVLEKHALAVKKESIAVMRRAIRDPIPNDISVARIVSSVSVAS